MDSVCLVCQGKLEEALRAFEALVQLHPHSPRARYGKAQVWPSSWWFCWFSSQLGLSCPHVLSSCPVLRRRTIWLRNCVVTRCCRKPSTPIERLPSFPTPRLTSWERRCRDELRGCSSSVMTTLQLNLVFNSDDMDYLTSTDTGSFQAGCVALWWL